MDETKLEELRVKHGGKVGAVEFSGHTLVFRRPSRDVAREYRRKKDSDVEKMDALDQLAQATIVAFDAEEDPTRARVTFTSVFLEEYPLATSNPKFLACLGALAGLVDGEEEKDLGKGVTVKSAPRSTTPKV
jgi:hypothetical protein